MQQTPGDHDDLVQQQYQPRAQAYASSKGLLFRNNKELAIKKKKRKTL